MSASPGRLGAVLFAGFVLPACTSYARPAVCSPGSTSCGGLSDARFCEYVALSVEGDTCKRLGIEASRPFWVVQSGPCVSTEYVLVDDEQHPCKVLEYESLRDSDRAESAADAPTFVRD